MYKFSTAAKLTIRREAVRDVADVIQAPVEKTCFILAYLTSCGRIPLLALNDIIASVLRGGPSRPIGWLLPHTFYQSRLATSPNTGLDQDQ